MRTTRRARAIEYEIVSRRRAATLTGLPPRELAACVGEIGSVAVVKCADEEGVRLTALGDPRNLHDLLVSDEGDIVLATSQWPIIFRGWLHDSRLSSGVRS